MGFNTSMMILNDGIDAIDRDLQGWWERTKEAIVMVHRKGFDPTVNADNHANVSQIIDCQHADIVQVVAVGGNYGALLGNVCTGGRHKDPEVRVEIIKQLANDLGYRLVKKSK